MKRQYRKLDFETKAGSINEPAKIDVQEADVFFDKKDICFIAKQIPRKLNLNKVDELIEEYYIKNNLYGQLYNIVFKHGERVYCVILSKEELSYLCE